jgi:methylisocitrate lyase
MTWELEAAGAAAVELEDQVAPKRVSHHRGVEHLVPLDEMVTKIDAFAAARQDPNFLLIARTGALRHEGIDAACNRLEAYAAAGADVVLVPIPATDDDFARVQQAIAVPIATIGLFDTAIDHYPPGVGLLIDAITPHVVVYRAVKDLLERHQRGETSGVAITETMTLYRELATVGDFESLYDIERATTEPE